MIFPFPGFESLAPAGTAAVYLIVALSAMVHGTLGVGFALVATPLLALLVDVRSAVLLLVLPTLGLNIVNTLAGGHARRTIARYWPLAAWGVLGSIVGTHLLIVSDPRPFKLLLAAMVLVYLNLDRIGLRLEWVRHRPLLASALFGLFAGFLGGTVNVMLPVLVVFALESDLTKTESVQIFNFCFFFGKITQGVLFAAEGLFGIPDILAAVPVVVIALAVSAAGLRLRSRIHTSLYRKWLRILLAVISVLLVWQFFSG